MLTLTKIKNQFFGGHARTAKANKNIIYSFLIKGLSIACQLALVPLTINYLAPSVYGIWQTIAQIVGWFSFFDIGIGNGLRNKLSEALAKGDTGLAKVYVSTSYACVTTIFLTLMVLFWLINPHLNWSGLLGLSPNLAGILQRTMLVVFSFFCIQFILNLIGNILFAHQEPALSNLITPLGNVASLIIIYILTKTTAGNLFAVSVVFSAAPVVVLLIFNVIFLGWKYRPIAPSFRHIQFAHSKDLFGLGVQFFFIQIAYLVMYSSANILLIRWFGPVSVTIYTVAYKYFTIALLINGIITATYWSAFTDAYIRQEFDWVRNTIRRMEKVTWLLMAAVVLQTLLAGPIIGLWVHKAIHVPIDIQITMCVFTLISLIAAPQHIFLNGTGKIRLQLYTAVYTIVMTIPFAWLFCKVLHLGPKGVVIAMICTSLPVTVLYRIQYNKIMSGKATGIWVR